MPASLTPRFIQSILAAPLLWPVARLALVSAYLLGGVTKLLNFPGAVQEQAHFGLHPAWLWAVMAIIVELGGSALVLAYRTVWLGRAGLAA
ncbi:DoxX family protein [Acidocella sp. MX-AZ03]|uniref:DoxX family protein n=1 Tax=Acidocella sp. MX-AZ03 TaxID=2697363 RepID=UPI0022DDE307|nr:DoxX family protein [Acidocella sp. MX-AZ03]WBO60990.1 DoxX family protein [Acidocella sp. MX-AZ03]